MNDTLLDRPDTIVPNEDDTRLAEESSRHLAAIKGKKPKSFGIRIETEERAETVPIPESVLRMLMDILIHMAKGNAVTLVPSHAELTTQQAADILNVSRPFVIQLVDTKQLPHHMVGTHRRIRFADLMDYKRRIDADRLKTLEELAKQAQELNMGY